MDYNRCDYGNWRNGFYGFPACPQKYPCYPCRPANVYNSRLYQPKHSTRSRLHINQTHYNLNLFELRRIWEQGITGKGVKVAVMDSGIDSTHPDFHGKIIGGYDFIDGYQINEAHPSRDTQGHGTFVAGIILQIAPEVSLLSYRVTDTGKTYPNLLLAALEQVLEDKVDIINISMSIGLDAPENYFTDIINHIISEGTAVVTMAGNNGPNRWTIESLGTFDNVITVGNSTKEDQIAESSSRGPVIGSWSIKPDLVAPGEDIISMALSSKYRIDSGSSYSAPHVTGVASLLKQMHPDWTPLEFKSALANKAVPFSDSNNELIPSIDQGSGNLFIGGLRTNFLVMPSNLNFGMVQPGKGQVIDRSLRIKNLTNREIEIKLIESHIPPGIEFHFSTTSLSPNETKDVSVQLRIAPLEAGIYQGNIFLAYGIDDANIPFILSVNSDTNNDIFPQMVSHVFRNHIAPANEYIIEYYLAFPSDFLLINALLVDEEAKKFKNSFRIYNIIDVVKGYNHLIWEGKDQKGTPLPDGVYFIEIKARLQGKDRSQFIRTFIDHTPVRIVLTNVTPDLVEGFVEKYFHSSSEPELIGRDLYSIRWKPVDGFWQQVKQTVIEKSMDTGWKYSFNIATSKNPIVIEAMDKVGNKAVEEVTR